LVANDPSTPQRDELDSLTEGCEYATAPPAIAIAIAIAIGDRSIVSGAVGSSHTEDSQC
jgi:hypothetical protein